MSENATTTSDTTVTNPASPPAPVIPPRSEGGTDPASKQGGPEQKPSTADAIRDKVKLEPFWKNLTRGKREKKPDEGATGDAKDDQEGKDKEEPDKKAEGEPTAEPNAEPKRKPRKTAVDPYKLAEIQGREIGKAITGAMPKPDQPAAPAATPQEDDQALVKRLDEDHQADADTYLEMKRLWPDKYGKLLNTLAAIPEKETEYAKKWEQAHPGETFDPDDKEHDDFYSGLEKVYSKADFKKAERELIKREAKAEALKEVAPDLEEYKRDRKLRTVQPEIDKEVLGVIGTALSEIDKDNVKLADSFDALKGLPEANPIAAEIVGVVGDRIVPLIQTHIKLSTHVEEWNPRNPQHVALGRVIGGIEQRVLAMPVEDRLDDDGRMFATSEEYSRMSESERAKHWYIGRDELTFALRGEAAQLARQMWASEQKKAAYWTKKSGAAPSNVSTAAQRESSTTKPKPDTTSSGHTSPTVTGRSTVGHDATNGDNTAKSGMDLFFSRLTHR